MARPAPWTRSMLIDQVLPTGAYASAREVLVNEYAKALGAPAARHPHPAGAVAARRRGEVAGPLEGCRRRLLRARRPCGHRAAAGRAGRVLRRPGRELLPDGSAQGAAEAAAAAGARPRAAGQTSPPRGRRRSLRYAATIQSQRGDYNGRVLSIRQDDLRALAVIYDESAEPAHRGADHLGRAQRRRAGGPSTPARDREPHALRADAAERSAFAVSSSLRQHAVDEASATRPSTGLRASSTASLIDDRRRGSSSRHSSS